MSIEEILDRIGDARRRRAWRNRPVGWSTIEGGGPLMGFPGLRTRLAAVASLPSVRASLERLEAGQLSYLGRNWPDVDFADGESKHFWLHDPFGRGLWPGAETSSFSVDVRSTSDDRRAPGIFGDVKFVWEPNRLQILHPLAAARADGSTSAGTTALIILRSWARANPPYAGVNWTSGIEMALRLVGVALLCVAVPSEDWEAEDRAFLRGFISAHADYLTAFPSRHSSANNHLIAEGLGLFLAGHLMPDRSTWAEEGRRIIEREAQRQILVDGVGSEQSPTYQAFTMEMLALAVLVSREVGAPLAAIVTERLVAGAIFLRALMNDKGRVPAIGDDDEGRVIGQPPDREPRYVASIVATAAGLTERPDLMPPAYDPHLRDGLFAVRWPTVPSDIGTQTFREGGYTTRRDRVGRRTTTLVFDHGPLGYLSLCAHGHADALAIWLRIDDQPVFIDAGTYLYYAGGARRTRLRESLAHNTLSVGGKSQSIAAPAFSWIHRAAAGLLSEDSAPVWSVTGWHDGYVRRLGVRHQRRISFVPNGYILEDRLVGSTVSHLCAIRFLLPPDLDLTDQSGTVLVAKDSCPLCRLVAPRTFAVSMESCPFSPRFGELATAQGIIFSGLVGTNGVSTRIEILDSV